MDTKNYESCLYKDIDGRLWDFFLTDESLFYNIDDHGEFYESTMLMENVKLYDIAVDKNGIYVVCLTTNGELCILTYKSHEWEEKIIKKSDKHSTIRKIHIYTVNNTIHIIYNSIHDTTRRPTLNHFYHLNNKWIYNPVNTNSLSSMHHYFIDSYNNSDIIVFYYSLMQNKLTLHAVVFSHTTSSWSKDKRITSNEIGTNITNLFIDSKNLLHILYCYGEQVYWKKFSMDIYTPFIKLKLLDQSVLTEYTPVKSYLLFERGNRFWSSWEIDNDIYILTNDNGHTWNNNQPLLDVDSQMIKFISCSNEQCPYIKSYLTYHLKINEEWFILGVDDLPGIPKLPIISKQLTNDDILIDSTLKDNDLEESNNKDDDLVEETIVESNLTEDIVTGNEDIITENNHLSKENHSENNDSVDNNTVSSNESIAKALINNQNELNPTEVESNITIEYPIEAEQKEITESLPERARKQVELFLEKFKQLFK